MMEAFEAFEAQARLVEALGDLDERVRSMLSRQREVAWRASWQACRSVEQPRLGGEAVPGPSVSRVANAIEPRRVGDLRQGEVGWVNPFMALIEHAVRPRGGSLRDVSGTGRVWVDRRATVLDSEQGQHSVEVVREHDHCLARGPIDRTRLAERAPDADPNFVPVVWLPAV